jgi:hypothetical protein
MLQFMDSLMGFIGLGQNFLSGFEFSVCICELVVHITYCSNGYSRFNLSSLRQFEHIIIHTNMIGLYSVASTAKQAQHCNRQNHNTISANRLVC